MRDEDLIRGNIPMTKSEVRAVSLSKLDLLPGETLYDVGAGTGSISVEAARLVPDLRVYAFEEKEEGCELIEANAKKFEVGSITIKKGHAPETFKGLPAPDAAFIGGSGGSLDDIVRALIGENPKVRIVLNAVTLETLTEALGIFASHSLDPEVVCVSVSRAEKAGSYHLMKALNPVYILTVN